MLLGTCSKAEIIKPNSVNDFKNTSNISVQKIVLHNNKNINFNYSQIDDSNKICEKLKEKRKISLLPKKKKKPIKQSDFEIKVLPKGQYTIQVDYTNNILVTKKIMVLK
jgi:hypothetical protein